MSGAEAGRREGAAGLRWEVGGSVPAGGGAFSAAPPRARRRIRRGRWCRCSRRLGVRHRHAAGAAAGTRRRRRGAAVGAEQVLRSGGDRRGAGRCPADGAPGGGGGWGSGRLKGAGRAAEALREPSRWWRRALGPAWLPPVSESCRKGWPRPCCTEGCPG